MWKRAVNWVETRARWSQLRDLGNSNLVKASVLMPIFGYMLLLNDNVHKYLTISFDGWLTTYLPNLWRIWLLFYGSFFVAVGTLIYSFFCPPEIKRYASSFEMADGEALHHISLGQYELLVEKIKQLHAELKGWHKNLMFYVLLPIAQGGFQNLTYEQRTGNLLVYQWTWRNHQYPGWRSAVFLLFCTGFLLLAVPAVVTFVQVTIMLLKRSIA
jgi:hypothetical protein